MKREQLIVAIAACGALAACKGSGVDGSLADRVVTNVEPAQVAAGESASVGCEIIAPDGGVVEGETTFAVEPEEGRTVDGDDVVAEVAGTYTVRCSAPGFGLTDTEGATLEVVPADPVKVTTILDDSEIPVHTTTNVECVAEDAFGNVSGVSTGVEADEGVSVEGHVVGAEEVGTYEVRCTVPDADGVTVEPADLVAVPGAPATVELLADPDNASYNPGAKVALYWVVTDPYGNVVPDVPGTLTVPSDGVSEVDAAAREYRLEAEGHHTFTVTLDPPSEPLTDDLTLTVDASGPEIVILWPERGETVQGDGGPLVVEGSVTDAFGEVAEFEINGEPVDVAEDGSFTHELVPYWGVNILLADATDDHGNMSKLTPTFAYSSEYQDFTGRDARGVKQENGAALLVGQAFLDDGDHDPAKMDDLATIVEVLLSDFDLVGLIEDLAGGAGGFHLFSQQVFSPSFNIGPLRVGATGDVDVTAKLVPPTDIGPTTVRIDSRVGGVDSSITLGDVEREGVNLTLEIQVAFYLGFTLLWDGDVLVDSEPATASATVFTEGSVDQLTLATELDIHKATGGDLFVELVAFDTELLGLEIDPIQDVVLSFLLDDLPFNLGPYQFDYALSELVDITQFTDALLDPITHDLVPFVVDLAAPLVEGFAGDLIRDLLLALELETSFDLPALLGPLPEPKSLDVYLDLSSVQFTDDGGQIGLGLGTWAEKSVERHPLGAIQRDGCLAGVDAEFAYSWERAFGGALKTDMVNAALFAVWRSGYLDQQVDLSGLIGNSLPIPISGATVDLQWLHPPVVNDCGPEGVIEAEVGDLYAVLDANLLGSPVHAILYLDAAVGLEFGSEEGGLTVTVGDFKFFDAEVLDIVDPVSGLFDLKSLLENDLDSLLGGFISGETFGPIEIPPISLSELVPGLPPGLVLQLGDFGVTKEQGYVVVGAGLE